MQKKIMFGSRESSVRMGMKNLTEQNTSASAEQVAQETSAKFDVQVLKKLLRTSTKRLRKTERE